MFLFGLPSFVAMASGLKKVGVLAWIGTNTQAMLSGMSQLLLLYRYLFLFSFYTIYLQMLQLK